MEQKRNKKKISLEIFNLTSKLEILPVTSQFLLSFFLLPLAPSWYLFTLLLHADVFKAASEKLRSKIP